MPWIAPLLPAEEAWTLTLPARAAAGAAMDTERVYVPLLMPIVFADTPPPVPPATAPPKTPVVVALDRQTGQTQWMAPIESQWPPVSGTGVLYVAAGTEVIALDAATGRERWKLALPGAPRAPMLLAGDLLVVLTAPDELVGIRIGTPAIAWRRSIAEQGPVVMNADASAVYVATAAGRLIRVLCTDGSIGWQVALDGELTDPAVTAERVFVGSKTNWFWAIETDDGSIDWRWPRLGSDVIGAAVDRHEVYVATVDSLRALNAGNGNQNWKRGITRPVGPPITFGGIVVVAGLSPTLSTFRTSSTPAPGAAPSSKPLGEWSAPPGAELQGRPLIDPVLRPFGVAMVVLLRDGRVMGLRPVAMKFSGPAVEPLTVLPGRPLSVEPSPGPPASPLP